MARLTAKLDELGERIEGPVPAQAAAETMADTMRSAIAARLGPDLRMRNFRGPAVVIDTEVRDGQAVVVLKGGTYALADKGRRQARARLYPRRSRALDTPWGPRANVKGSTWPGFGFTERAGPEATKAGIEAARKAIRKGL